MEQPSRRTASTNAGEVCYVPLPCYYCQLAELKTPNDYRLFNFDFVDANFDDFYRAQIVLKMFLEIDVVDKFNLSVEVLPLV